MKKQTLNWDDAFVLSKGVEEKISLVDASFAISKEGLREVIKLCSSGAESVGVSVDELISLATLVYQITGKDCVVIGSALKVIFAKFSQEKTIKKLIEMGVYSSEKSKITTSILKSVARKFEEFGRLSNKNKDIVIELCAGIYYGAIFKIILNDLAEKDSTFYECLNLLSPENEHVIEYKTQKGERLNIEKDNEGYKVTIVGTIYGGKFGPFDSKEITLTKKDLISIMGIIGNLD